MRPVIFTAFANQQDAYLPTLKEESRLINASLKALHDLGAIEHYREESAGVQELLDTFTRFRDRISIFHYAGHAGGKFLELEGGNGDATGIAQLLGQLPNLKLVFLNGCSTAPQVDHLMNQGVKAVIATSTPINDTKATELAGHFYRALSNKSTIRDAFRFAVNAIRTQYGGQDVAQIIQHRGFGDTAPVEIPWALYVNPDFEAATLDWTMPNTAPNTGSGSAGSALDANKYLVDVLPEIAKNDKEVDAAAYDADGKFILDTREAIAMVIEKFPWPIGIQLRLLSSNDQEMSTATQTRLRQITSAYIHATQMLAFIGLSQVWNLRRDKVSVPGAPLFNELLELDQARFLTYDYFSLAIRAIKAIKDSGNETFLPEMSDVLDAYNSKGEIYDAFLYLESLRQRLTAANTATLDQEIVSLCADGEFHLSTVLIHVAFLCKYDLLIVRDINISTPRAKDPEFNHFMGKLNVNAANSLAVSRKPRSYAKYMVSSSVIISKDITRPDQFLNLSPFIIDKNAFASSANPVESSNMVPNIFMFGFKNAGSYFYFCTIHDIYRSMTQETDQINTGEENKAELRNRERTRDRSRTLDKAAGDAVSRPYASLAEDIEAFRRDMNG